MHKAVLISRTAEITSSPANTNERSAPSLARPVGEPDPKSRPGRWALVQVWNGAVLASFDNETSAREAITQVDDDEVVVLYVGRKSQVRRERPRTTF